MSLRALLDRMEDLEAKVNGTSDGAQAHPHSATSEVWYQHDFSI